MPVKEIVKPKVKLRHSRTTQPDCYVILLSKNKQESLQKLEDAYKKIVTNNELVKPIRVLFPSEESFVFNLPIELRAFILGVMAGDSKWR